MTYEEKLKEAVEEYYHYHPEDREKTTFEDASRIVMTILKIIGNEDWLKDEMEQYEREKLAELRKINLTDKEI
jgi:hypothetical protein